MMIARAMLIAAMTLGAPALAGAQDMSGMDMSGLDRAHAATAATPAPANPAALMHNMDMSGMTGDLGAYPMTRDASGTSWQPDSSPMDGIMASLGGGWSAMLHGYATLLHDAQGGPRGSDKTFVQSMLMGMAQHDVAGGTLTLRGMISLDPAMGKRGYPLLLQTGETADGHSELVDRQHPHDFLMELAAVYSHRLSGRLSGFVYFGLPGEPALGPATYMHRFSGVANPEAPIGHHWLDSTHITFGVATAGLVYGALKLEASLFTGREPDQFRWNFDRPRFDSWSVRATLNPTRNLSMQVSHGLLHSPEQLQPDENVRRTTASITWNLPLGQTRHGLGRNWQSTFAWGRNDRRGGDHDGKTDAFMLDSALQLGDWTVFGRAENVDKDELFENDNDSPLQDRAFDVTKVSLGGYRSFPVGKIAFELGGLVSKYGLPDAIKPAYGADPTSFMVFTRIRIAG